MPVPSNSRIDENIPVPGVVPVRRRKGDDEEETALLRGRLEQATTYIQSFSSYDSVVSSYFAGGVGKIFAVFLFKIVSRRPDVDPWERVFGGDVPPA
jgi:hypothetical protein